MKIKHRHGWSNTLPVLYGHRLSALEHLDKAAHLAGFSMTAELELAAPVIGVWRRAWRRVRRLIVATFRHLTR